jgi:hypothetical protein
MLKRPLSISRIAIIRAAFAIVLIATIVAWIRSYPVRGLDSDMIVWGYTEAHAIMSVDGDLRASIGWVPGANPSFPPGSQSFWHTDGRAFPFLIMPKVPVQSHFMFFYWNGASDYFPNGRNITIAVRYWVIVTALALMHSFVEFTHLHRLPRRRWLAEGRCQHCGYDLRASQDRCPECGQPFRKQQNEPTV